MSTPEPKATPINPGRRPYGAYYRRMDRLTATRYGRRRDT